MLVADLFGEQATEPEGQRGDALVVVALPQQAEPFAGEVLEVGIDRQIHRAVEALDRHPPDIKEVLVVERHDPAVAHRHIVEYPCGVFLAVADEVDGLHGLDVE